LGIAEEHGKKMLQRMSLETGGQALEVTKDQTIEAIYSKIDEALRNQYSIGFTPQESSAPGKFHKIKLTTRQPGMLVRTRTGYYSR
jgi:VWFA-related protein